jgi:LysM repeat protein
VASTRSYFFAICAIAGLVLSACGAADPPAPTPIPTIPLPTPRPTLTPQATPTRVPVTLPPPRLPTVTPTPVTYIVQEGDTPIVIANKFGVSVNDLIAVNNIDPSNLPIGKVLVIPLGPQAGPQGTTLLPTPTPAPYEVRGLNVYRTPAGSLEILGEVYNPGPDALGSVQLQVALKNEAGQDLVVAPFFVAQELVRAGQTSPFRVLFTDPPAGYTNYAITMLRGERIDTTVRYADLQVTKNESAPSGQQFRIAGEITNADAASAASALVVATTYDADGRVVGYRQAIAGQGPIAPGAVVPFELILTSSVPAIARYTVTVEGLKQ